MKKILILTAVLLLAGVLAVALPLNNRFTLIQYQKTLERNALVAAEEDGWLHAQQGECLTNVEGGNISRITRALTPGEAQRIWFASELQNPIILTYSNGDCVRLAADPDAEDRALIQLTSDGSTVSVAIEGYRVMQSVAAAVSPEGFSQPNTVLEGESSS